MSEQTPEEQKPQSEKFNKTTDLSGMEHFIIGSGINVGGYISDAPTLISLMTEGVIPDSFFTPSSQDPQLNNRRKVQGELSGAWGAFDTEVVPLDVLMASPVFKLEPIVNGKTPSEWELTLTKGSEILEDPVRLKEMLPIRKDIGDLLSIEEKTKALPGDKVKKVAVLRINPRYLNK